MVSARALYCLICSGGMIVRSRNRDVFSPPAAAFTSMSVDARDDIVDADVGAMVVCLSCVRGLLGVLWLSPSRLRSSRVMARITWTFAEVEKREDKERFFKEEWWPT